MLRKSILAAVAAAGLTLASGPSAEAQIFVGGGNPFFRPVVGPGIHPGFVNPIYRVPAFATTGVVGYQVNPFTGFVRPVTASYIGTRSIYDPYRWTAIPGTAGFGFRRGVDAFGRPFTVSGQTWQSRSGLYHGYYQIYGYNAWGGLSSKTIEK
jgi:hypothetical protein